MYKERINYYDTLRVLAIFVELVKEPIEEHNKSNIEVRMSSRFIFFRSKISFR